MRIIQLKGGLNSFRHLTKCHNLLVLLCYANCRSHATFSSDINKNSVSRREIEASYRVLGLKEGCSALQLKDTFIRLAKAYHPDSTSPSACAEEFSRIEKAYKTLKARIPETSEPTSEEEKQVDAGEASDFSFKHMSLQHRQYLDFEGLGLGTPSQRYEQYQKYKVSRASENVLRYRLQNSSLSQETAVAAKNMGAARQVKSSNTIDRVAEDLILESMRRGDFDDLPGKGKPLKHHGNPLIDFTTFNLNQMLIREGYAPEWVVLIKEIKASIKKVRSWLQTETNEISPKSDKWTKVTREFKREVKIINQSIDRYNMTVPTIRQQLPHLSVQKEMAKIEVRKERLPKFEDYQTDRTVPNEGRPTVEKFGQIHLSSLAYGVLCSMMVVFYLAYRK